MSWAEIVRLDPPRVEYLPDDDYRIVFMYGFRYMQGLLKRN